MRCASCQTENDPSRKFCVECGTRLAVACPSCGSANPPNGKFCGECGTALGGDAEAPPAAEAARTDARVAERRLVSILFADLVGFTAQSEQRDPEEVRELLSRYFAAARDTIERYGGNVEKFIGDAVMAVWGAPTAHEDDAERAVRAALELVDVVGGEIAGKEAETLQLRAAVLTGEAAVTLNATGEGMVAGDLVNTASRLQSVAEPGSVLVGEATYRSSRDAVAYEAVEDKELKGKTLPVKAWRALRIVAGRGGARRSEGLEAPFVGRDQELRQLKDLLEVTTRDGRARLVSIVGQPGIGKSRLVWEFEKHIDGVVQAIYWHQGRSPAYGEGITFWALGEMVRQRAGLAEIDDPATTLARLEATLTENVPDEQERRWIEPRLAALLGAQEVPPGDRAELFAAWRAFFERISDRGTTVLVFEDLQWADAGLVEFLESLLEWSRNHPILVLTIARPELLDRYPNWGAGQRSFTSLHLDALSDAAMVELLAGLVPGLPDEAVRRILGRAEGIPLYAVETVRMLLDSGQLVRDEEAEHYQLSGELGELRAPESLRGLIAARLDGLDQADRELVQDASVLGLFFTTSGLSALQGKSETELEPRLRNLVQRELLVFDADPRSPERGQYGFIQGIMREVAHETLARSDRRAKHLAAARHLESLGDDELAGVLASHYYDAYQATPPGPEADAIVAQARIALRAAAERAAALHSPDQAIALYEQALGITIEPSERAALMERAAEAAQEAARYDVTEGYLDQAIAIHREHGDVEAVAVATARLGGVVSMSGHPDRAIEEMEAALSALGEMGGAAAARLNAGLARACMFTEQWARALELSERALILAAAAGDVATVAEALTTKGPVLDEVGRRQEGVALLAGALRLAEAHGLNETRYRATFNLAGRLYADDQIGSYRLIREGQELARKLGNRTWLVVLTTFAMRTATDLGEWDWIMTQAEDLLQGEMPPIEQADVEASVALVLAYRGDQQGAEERHAASAKLLEGVTRREVHGWYRFDQGQLAAIAGRFDEAYERMMGVVDLSSGAAEPGFALAANAAALMRDRERLGAAHGAFRAIATPSRIESAHSEVIEAALAAIEGRSEEAAAGFRRGLAEYRDLQWTVPLGWALLICVSTLGPDHPQAEAAAAEARELFTRLGAKALLDRLDDALVPVHGSHEGAIPTASVSGGMADSTHESPARAGAPGHEER
jgi:class 3 adenylate cyclase/predicted ATPase